MIPEPKYRSKTKPFKHQWKEFQEHRNSRKRAMNWSMRTGKTKAIFDLADYLHQYKEIEAMIVIAPDGVQTNWIKRELPVHFAGEARSFIYNPNASDQVGYKSRFNTTMIKQAYDGRLQIFAIGADSIRTERGKKYLTEVIRGRQGRVLLVIDEAHMFGSPSSSRGRVARALGKACNWVRIMSGSMGGNSPMRIWAPYEILEPGALGFTTHGAFKQQFAVEMMRKGKDGRQFPEITEYKNLDDLALRTAKWTSIVRRDECEDMPKLNIVERIVEMTDAQKKVYKAVEKDGLLDEYEVSGAGLLGKLAQIAAGWYYDEFGTAIDVVDPAHNPLVKAVLNEVSDGRKYIIWANHTHDLDLMAAALKKADITFVKYYGSKSTKAEKQAAIDAFMNNDFVKVFLGQPKSGGVGLNLSAANAIIWMSHTFDIVIREQADERATKVAGANVDIINFVVDGTVFSYILSAQKHKIDIREQVAGLGLRTIIDMMGLL